MDYSATVQCDKVHDCITAGRYSMCYKTGMQTRTFFTPDEKPSEELPPVVDLKKMISDHWSYIEKLLQTHNTHDDEIRVIEFHYKTAFEHGYKHRDEELR